MDKKTVTDYFGTQEKVADFVGIGRTAVVMWQSLIPVKYALILDDVTHGELRFDKKMYQAMYRKNGKQKVAL